MRKVGMGIVVVGALLGALRTGWAKEKAEPKVKPQGVVLGFEWPVALGADVTYRWTRTKTGKPAQGVTLVGHMKVATEGENLRIEYRDWKPQTGGTAPDAPPNALLDAAPVVDKKGAVVRVDGAAPALLKASVARAWQMLVGSWAGNELELGKEYVATIEAPVPVVPGGKLKTTLRFRAERLLDCPGAPSVRCVELKLRSEPDRKSMAKLATALGASSGDKSELKSTDLSAVEEATLVTEPGRLIPHRLSVTKTIELRPTREDPEPRSQVDRTTWTYDYPAAKDAAPTK